MNIEEIIRIIDELFCFSRRYLLFANFRHPILYILPHESLPVAIQSPNFFLPTPPQGGLGGYLFSVRPLVRAWFRSLTSLHPLDGGVRACGTALFGRGRPDTEACSSSSSSSQ